MTQTKSEINKYKFVGGPRDGDQVEVRELHPVLLVPGNSPCYSFTEKRDARTVDPIKVHRYHRMQQATLRGVIKIEYWHDSVYKLHMEKEALRQRYESRLREIKRVVNKL